MLDGGGVSLEVIDADSCPRLVQAVEALRVRPAQEGYVVLPRHTLPAALEDDGRTPFAVRAAGGPRPVVGFGVLDRHGYLDQLLDAPERTVMLRAFCIGEAHQGRGHGSRAARAVRDLGRRVAPSAELVVLTVSSLNTAGQRAYARAGYADTGVRYEGTIGEEWVMAATTPALRSGSPAAPAAGPEHRAGTYPLTGPAAARGATAGRR